MPDSKPETARVPMVVVPVELLRRCREAAAWATAAPINDHERKALWDLDSDLRDALAAH